MKQDIEWRENHALAWEYLVEKGVFNKDNVFFPINLSEDTTIPIAQSICAAMVDFRNKAVTKTETEYESRLDMFVKRPRAE